jgi:hypothetical protein
MAQTFNPKEEGRSTSLIPTRTVSFSPKDEPWKSAGRVAFFNVVWTSGTKEEIGFGNGYLFYKKTDGSFSYFKKTTDHAGAKNGLLYELYPAAIKQLPLLYVHE